MFKWFKDVFIKPVPPLTPPTDNSLIGTTWVLKDEDPWTNLRITIIEEKDGWVRYQFPAQGNKWAMQRKDLELIYERVK